VHDDLAHVHDSLHNLVLLVHDDLAHVHDSLHNLVLLVPLVAFMLSPPVARGPRARPGGPARGGGGGGAGGGGGRAYAPAMGVRQGAGR
jgi:hypothetical protein